MSEAKATFIYPWVNMSLPNHWGQTRINKCCPRTDRGSECCVVAAWGNMLVLSSWSALSYRVLYFFYHLSETCILSIYLSVLCTIYAYIFISISYFLPLEWNVHLFLLVNKYYLSICLSYRYTIYLYIFISIYLSCLPFSCPIHLSSCPLFLVFLAL